MQIRKFKLKVRTISFLAILLTPLLLQAQEDCGDECKLNTNLAMVINWPVSSSAQVVGTGWGIVGGAGYNFNKRSAIIGEFMWNRVYPASGALQPFQAVLQSKDIHGNTDFYTLTANYRFELRGRFAGAYLIGGGGWYFREYLTLSTRDPFQPRERVHPSLALVWIYMHIRNGESKPAAGHVQHQHTRRERGHRDHSKGWRGSLPILCRGALPLRSYQEHEHPLCGDHAWNPILS